LRIAIVTHYFWPELGAPSARLLELGRSWVVRGHEVTVVTNFPNHPTGVVPEAYRGRSFEVESKDGLRIVRCRTYATPNRGFLKKTLGHLYFMAQAVLQATPHVRGTDVVVASSPTLFAAVAGLVVSRRLGVPFVLEVRDLWPAIFVDLGVIRNRAAIRLLEQLELFLYRRSAAVVTVTRSFAEDIARRGIERGKLHVVPNGVDLAAFEPGPPDAALRTRLGLDGKFVLLYCGAHGISHALGRLLEAAERLGDDPRFHLLFVGEGAEKDALEERARERALANVTFLPAVPREQVAALYRSAEVCLVPLRAVPLFRGFIPSKMFEILACGRPALASVEGEAAEILRESGAAVVVPPEDVDSLVAAAHRLAADAVLRAELAARGRPYVAANFDRDALGERYLSILGGAAAAGRAHGRT
jgi:glycosyltransferase involved in cell wall biosynthesis